MLVSQDGTDFLAMKFLDCVKDATLVIELLKAGIEMR